MVSVFSLLGHVILLPMAKPLAKHYFMISSTWQKIQLLYGGQHSHQRHDLLTWLYSTRLSLHHLPIYTIIGW